MTVRVSSLWLLVVCMALGPLVGTSEATQAGGVPRADAVLYELTEHAVITPAGVRDASSALHGKADFGSPLCPLGLQAHAKEFYKTVFDINVKLTPRCSVVAMGRSQLDVNSLTGTIDGEFWVVVNSDFTNKTDAQELFVMNGTFAGTIAVTDPDLVIIEILPGSTFTPMQTLPGFPVPPSATFTGTFRLPFTVHHVAVYKSDRGRLVPVGADERALGAPTVRLEVTFD